jgi:hypothetical protein
MIKLPVSGAFCVECIPIYRFASAIPVGFFPGDRKGSPKTCYRFTVYSASASAMSKCPGSCCVCSI